MELKEYFVKRLIELRQQSGVSARDMSLSLGQSAGYINKIETQQNLPSLTGFFYVCDYFNISPHNFFDEEELPPEIIGIFVKLKKLSPNELKAVEGILDVIIDRGS